MKKLLCAFLLVVSLSGASFAAASRNVGILTMLNSTQEEFQAYMDAALSAGIWTMFTSGNTDLDQAIFVFYDSLMAMQLGLNKGEVDEIDLPETVGEYMLNTNPDYVIACISITKPISFAFGFLERNSALRDSFNDALKAMKQDGTLAILHSKYVNEPGIKPFDPVKFEKYDDAKTIHIAVTGDLPPIDFVATDGTPAGFNTAILAEIGKRLHLNIDLLDIDASARVAALTSGRADVAFWFQVHAGDTQPDIPNGVILSESYYDWNKYLHIKKK